MLAIKNTLTQMKNAFDGFIIRINMPKESESLKMCQQKFHKVKYKQKKKNVTNVTENPKTMRQLQKMSHMQNWNTRMRREKEIEEIVKIILPENFPNL